MQKSKKKTLLLFTLRKTGTSEQWGRGARLQGEEARATSCLVLSFRNKALLYAQAGAGVKRGIFLLLSPTCRHDRCEPPCLKLQILCVCVCVHAWHP